MTHEVAAKMEEYARGIICASGSSLFEELGMYYIGPVDGHDVEDLVTPCSSTLSLRKEKGILLLRLRQIKCMVRTLIFCCKFYNQSFFLKCLSSLTFANTLLLLRTYT